MDRRALYEAQLLIDLLRRTIPVPGRGCTVEQLDEAAELLTNLLARVYPAFGS